MGKLGHPFADPRRPSRRLSGRALRAGGQGSRCPGGYGRHFLQTRQHSRHRRCHQIAGLGAVDRLGRLGRSRGADHPDRSGAGIVVFTGDWALGRTKDHPPLGRRGRGHRGHLQHAAWRRPVCDRNPPARSLEPHLPAGRHRDWRVYARRAHPHRPQSGLCRSRSLLSLRQLFRRRGGNRLHSAWGPVRGRRLGVHSAPGVHGGRLSQAARQHLHPEHRRHGSGRPHDGRPSARVRSFLCRRRRLWRHPVYPRQRHDGDEPPGSVVRAQAPGHDRQPRQRRFGRHFLALALSRRDARRGFRVGRHSGPSQRRPDIAVGGDRRHGGRWSAREPAAF